jgi:hypothetical protein
MSIGSLEQLDRDYLQQLYDQVGGDASAQVSMYDVGEALDLDRDKSSQVAQTLIGLDLAEIKTLSGGIGISPDGISLVEGAGGVSGESTGAATRLSNEHVMSQDDLEAIEEITTYLKKEAGGLGLNYDDLTELVADLRTIDAQLTSSRPKTGIVRSCLESIEAVMKTLGHREAGERLHALIGE